MSFSFAFTSKSQSNSKKLAASAVLADDPPPTSAAARNYISEFDPAEVPSQTQPKVKPIAPIPDDWRPMKKLKNLPNLPSLSKANGSDSSLQFEIDARPNPEAADNSMAYGLNIRQEPAADDGFPAPDRREKMLDLEIRRLREDMEKLPEDAGMDDFADVPVEGFGLALLSGYGWKEGMGIGRNAKEDVKISEVMKKTGRGGLGFTEEFSENRVESNGKGAANFGDSNVKQDKRRDETEKKRLNIGKEVRIVSGREIGMKGKIVEVRSGEILVLRLSGSIEKVKVQSKDVAELGSLEEEKCLRSLKEWKTKDGNVNIGKGHRNSIRKMSHEDKKRVNERVNWLRNHIRVRIISKDLKGGRLFLKKGVVVDVVGPGMCDVSMDESRELIQGVEQEFLETALPRRGGTVLVLCGRHKGVYGSLLEHDSEKETGVVRDADTHETLNVRLDEIAEYTGDPSDIGY
ncbi:protein MOS2-like [Primulina eburnea]|uniref:protein MOS2-like n=1 Tax=Primulina eburnea TaxID=1245227 RepID=UPI003C6BEA3F